MRLVMQKIQFTTNDKKSTYYVHTEQCSTDYILLKVGK